jgi:hypothetical protein
LNCAEGDLRRISDFIDAVNECGKALSTTLVSASASYPIAVGQHVIAKSILHNGEWRNAVVMSVNPW